MNSRGWTWIDSELEKITEEKMTRREPVLNSLAQQWSQLHNEDEQRAWRRQAIRDGEYDAYEPEDEADAYRVQQLDRLRQEQHDAQMVTIENQLAALGARMMRPYEHWNEDERYMQYMECDRFGESCY